MTTLLPPALSTRLQKRFRIPIAFPGIIVPPGVTLPPGTIVPPGIDVPDSWMMTDPLPAGVWLPAISWGFPPGWLPGAPLPEGVIVGPDVVWPEGWQLGDPLPIGVFLPDGFYYPPMITPTNVLPPGTIVPPGTVFPPGWQYGDPLPAGVILPPGWDYSVPWTPNFVLPVTFTVEPGTVFPPGWKYGDPLPPGVTLPPGTIYGYPASTSRPDNFEPFPPGPPKPTGDTSPPIGAKWLLYYDDAAWQSWAGATKESFWLAGENCWSSPEAFFTLEALPSWTVGFKPTKFRLKVLQVTGNFSLTLRNKAMGIIKNFGNYVSESEIDITVSAADEIGYLGGYATNSKYSLMAFYG